MCNESTDPVLEKVHQALTQLLMIKGFNALIPQVGSNLVFAKDNAISLEDISALSGRIIATINGPIACGEIAYGTSRYLASVILEAMKHDDTIRAALNICVRDDITRKLKQIGLKIVEIPGKIKGKGCPVTHFIEKNTLLMDAYIHPGDFGIEPTTTIIGKDPEMLVNIIRKLS
jgi:predicted fused transcriptional regulator/phosphomethylpyrimidine kinase